VFEGLTYGEQELLQFSKLLERASQGSHFLICISLTLPSFVSSHTSLFHTTEAKAFAREEGKGPRGTYEATAAREEQEGGRGGRGSSPAGTSVGMNKDQLLVECIPCVFA
jgi:hypothetical protein